MEINNKKESPLSRLQKLQDKWGLKSVFQTIMVLIVFAVTGSTVLFLKPLVFNLVGLEKIKGFSGIMLYLVLVFPLYQVLILLYGFIFGQFAFFWAWEKKFVTKFVKLFKRPRTN